MSAKVFNSLLESLQEAGGILRGEIADFRSFTVDWPRRRNPPKALAVYIGKDDDLIEGKIYRVKILSSGSFVVRDENKETVICSNDDFLILKFQPTEEKLLRERLAA